MGIMENLKKMDAQPTERQQAALQQALGSLETDPKALSTVLDVYGDIIRNKVHLHNIDVQQAKASGLKFPIDYEIHIPDKYATPSTKGINSAPVTGSSHPANKYKR